MYLLPPMVPAIMGFRPSGIVLYCTTVFLPTALMSETRQSKAVDTTSASSASTSITHLSIVPLPRMVKHPSSGDVTIRTGPAAAHRQKSDRRLATIFLIPTVFFAKISILFYVSALQKYTKQSLSANVFGDRRHRCHRKLRTYRDCREYRRSMMPAAPGLGCR